MSVHEDRLQAEVDRQLAEIRAACDGLATRAGFLIAALAAVAAILAPRIEVSRHEILLVVALIAFGIASLAAAVTLMPGLKIGPLVSSLAAWGAVPSAGTSGRLFDSKIVILEADYSRLQAMRIFFAIQAIATILATGLALWYTAWR